MKKIKFKEKYRICKCEMPGIPNKIENKNIYRFEDWSGETRIDEAMERLGQLYKEGWEVVSHAQNAYGMSVILKRRNEKI